MKKECEELFIILTSPYITAREVAKQYVREDWHGVFAVAEALHELLGGLNSSEIAGSEQLASILESDVTLLRTKAKSLSDIALNQESRTIHGSEPDPKLSTEALNLVGEISGKLRQVIVDNVCACEAGGEIVEAYQEGKFPKQDKSLRTIHGLTGGFPLITQIHDDGDLTVEADGKKYVVTTEGGIFAEEKT